MNDIDEELEDNLVFSFKSINIRDEDKTPPASR